tara:strand:+ start:3417 stop:5663 length:2247 start_codon:yes stop_codon:yes gene_type:complete
MAKKKNNYNMSVVDLSHYNIPHIIENDNKDWVSFGVDNLYPQYLIELFTGSGINSAIIKGVSSMIAGDQQGTCQGLDVVDKDILEGEQKEQYLLFSKLLKKGSRNTIKNLAFDLKLFGTCYVNTIWNKTKTAIVELKHIPAQYVRSGKADSFGKVNEYYYCYDWSNQRKYKPSIIKAFNPEDRTATSQLLQIKEYNPQSFYYGIPDYIGGTDYINLDMSISELHLANIENNFMPSCMVSMNNGIPSDEQRMEVERKLNEKFSGSGNSGKLIITFNEGKETAPEIIPLNTGDNDDKYQFLSTEVSRKILTAHRVTSPLLFGVKGDGSGFGNNADELRDSYSLFNSSVIKVFQSSILQGLDEIFRINGINSLDIYFKTLKPADFLDLDHVDAIDEQTEGIDIEEDVTQETVVAPVGETPEPMPEDTEEIEVVQDVEASYNGAQISSAIDIVAKVQEGILNKDQAIVFLIQFLQLPPEVAQRFFEGEEQPKPMVENLKNILKNLKKKKISSSVSEFKSNFKGIDVEDDKVCLDYFDDIGITLDNNEWFEAYVEGVDDHKVDKRYHEFAYAPAGTPNVADSSSDIGMFRVLYRYSQSLSINKKTGQISSREFCQKMVAKSVAGTLYRIEDLEKASKRAVNKGFGAGGSNTYNIALYKGGANCKHKWERVFYFRRIVPQGMTFVDTDGKEYQGGEYLPNGTLNNFRLVSQQFANGKMPMPDDAEMRKTTWKMKNHGFLKPRKEKERSYSTKAN